MMLTRDRKIQIGFVACVVVLVLLRVWWVSPKLLHGGPLLERIEKRRGDYTLVPRDTTTFEQMVKTNLFGNYVPFHNSDFKERHANKSSRFVRESDYHNYSEYVTANGRLRLHNSYRPSSEFDQGGDTDWIELLPTDLPVDRFFAETIAVHLNLDDEDFDVYIPHEVQGQYMTVHVRNRKVSRIAWLPFP